MSSEANRKRVSALAHASVEILRSVQRPGLFRRARLEKGSYTPADGTHTEREIWFGDQVYFLSTQANKKRGPPRWYKRQRKGPLFGIFFFVVFCCATMVRHPRAFARRLLVKAQRKGTKVTPPAR